MFSGSVRKTKADSNEDILLAVKAAALAYGLHHKLPEAKSETLTLTLGYAKCHLIVDTPVETLREAQTKTQFHVLRDVRIKATSDTQSDVEATKVVDTWAETVNRVKTRTVDDTVARLEAKALINFPGEAIA